MTPHVLNAGMYIHTKKDLRMFTTYKAAEAVCGKLGTPSKMPGYTYGIPAIHCPVGKLLVKVPNSVCSKCYALKGRYVFGNVKKSQTFRFNSLRHPEWVNAISFLINKRADPYFRWHDSGDLQGMWHLENIVAVALKCPDTRFWLPTRETKLMRDYLSEKELPQNLTVRVSGTMIDGPAPNHFPNTSTVVTDGNETCHANRNGGLCGKCRACWDPSIGNISYPRH